MNDLKRDTGYCIRIQPVQNYNVRYINRYFKTCILLIFRCKRFT